MRIVYHAESIVDAHLVKDALDHAGIPCFINGEYLTGGVGQLPARDYLTVSVPDVCVDAAGPVVREISEMLQAPLQADVAEPVPGSDTGATPPLRLRPSPI
ncbi:MAG: DUF2007 domain-containing protein [Proteobacteria bacterium]|nr:DUF2007 domain-containing protein [Pseudomonadota bacterium]